MIPAPRTRTIVKYVLCPKTNFQNSLFMMFSRCCRARSSGSAKSCPVIGATGQRKSRVLGFFDVVLKMQQLILLETSIIMCDEPTPTCYQGLVNTLLNHSDLRAPAYGRVRSDNPPKLGQLKLGNTQKLERFELDP